MAHCQYVVYLHTENRVAIVVHARFVQPARVLDATVSTHTGFSVGTSPWVRSECGGYRPDSALARSRRDVNRFRMHIGLRRIKKPRKILTVVY